MSIALEQLPAGRVLMVAPFPPYRDGIAAYAVQEYRSLRDRGWVVDVVSPLPSAARFHVSMGGARGIARLARMVTDYERVIIQFGPEMLFGQCRGVGERLAVWAGLAGLGRAATLELRLHEIEYGPLDRHRAERAAAAAALRAAARVTVHTEAERADVESRLGRLPNLKAVAHGRDFRTATGATRAEARASLGLDDHTFAFLAIGFLQSHKGFDIAVEAIDRLEIDSGDVAPHLGPDPEPHLFVVGSARIDHPEINAYVDRLRAMCGASDRATLHEGYISDERFDRWILAADAVVLPYREIWSSGVLERARLQGTLVIATDLPQLTDQVPPGSVLFSGMEQLTEAMGAALSEHLPDYGADEHHDRTDRPGVSRVRAAADVRPRWEVDVERPDRRAVQTQISDRARSAQLEREGVDAAAAVGRPVDGLLDLGPLHRPQPRSTHPGIDRAKRLVQRLVDWRVEPVASRVEELQQATLRAVAELERRQADDRDEPESEFPNSFTN